MDQRFRISWQFQLRQLIVIGEIRSQPPTLISTHMSLLLCVFPVGLVSNLPNILIGIFSLPIPSISTTSPNSKRKCFSPLCDASCLYPTPLIHFFILYSTWLHLTSINNGTKLDVLKILLKPFFFLQAPSSIVIVLCNKFISNVYFGRSPLLHRSHNFYVENRKLKLCSLFKKQCIVYV